MLANHATRHHAGNAAEPGDTKVPCIKLEKTKDRRSIHQKDGESSAISLQEPIEMIDNRLVVARQQC